MSDPKKTFYYRYIKARIDQVWGWYPQRRKALNRAATSPMAFRCEGCGTEPLTRKQVEVDHTVPRDNPAGWDGYDNYIERTFCSSEGLRILCRSCHQPKSNAENTARRARRKKEATHE